MHVVGGGRAGGWALQDAAAAPACGGSGACCSTVQHGARATCCPCCTSAHRGGQAGDATSPRRRPRRPPRPAPSSCCSTRAGGAGAHTERCGQRERCGAQGRAPALPVPRGARQARAGAPRLMRCGSGDQWEGYRRRARPPPRRCALGGPPAVPCRPARPVHPSPAACLSPRAHTHTRRAPPSSRLPLWAAGWRGCPLLWSCSTRRAMVDAPAPALALAPVLSPSAWSFGWFLLRRPCCTTMPPPARLPATPSCRSPPCRSLFCPAPPCATPAIHPTPAGLRGRHLRVPPLDRRQGAARG